MEFIAIDGEGITVNDKHIYTLIGASNGSYIWEDTGLATGAIFGWLFHLKESNPNATFISYVFSYDVNMILQMLPFRWVKVLAKHDHVNFVVQGTRYRIEYLPRKYFRLTKYIGKTPVTITVYDIFGFFQKSFVKACDMFNLLDDGFIASMKGTRSAFKLEDKEQIIAYNMEECRLMVILAERIADALELAGYPIASYHGPGAVASKVFQVNKVKDKLYQSTEHYPEVMGAYFGGKTFAAMIGEIDKVYQYDIVSAYPYALSLIPEFTAYDLNAEITDYSLVTCRFITEYGTYGVLPIRRKDGRIHYPMTGSGTYWGVEVLAAMAYGVKVEVDKVITFKTGDPVFPFIAPLFESRKIAKAQGSPAQLGIKLALNSCYGKLAQAIGYDGKTPAYQSYAFAGWTTAKTRAMMIELCKQAPDDIIAVSTDGIFSRVPLVCKEGTNLGDYEAQVHSNFFIARSGVYYSDSGAFKTRGFSTLAFDELREDFRVKGMSATFRLYGTEFVGMKRATTPDTWGLWRPYERIMRLTPALCLVEPLQRSPRLYRLIQGTHGGQSYPYTPDLAAEKHTEVLGENDGVLDIWN